MLSVHELYQVAAESDIPVLLLDLPENGSMCIETARRHYIGLDPSVLEEEASQTVHLAHELGHCITGSFYNRWAARDVRQRHENRADKWAIQKVVPVDALDQAIADGHTTIWELAEHFNVTEVFMQKAVCWYTHGNLAAALYF